MTTGISSVAREIATKPYLAYSAVPAGAPMAKATYIAIPTHAMTLPVFCGPTSPRPQLNAPVMTKLSAAPRAALPARRIPTDVAGLATKGSEAR